MNFKNILATVAISAATTGAVIWGYGKYQSSAYNYAEQNVKELPPNYKYTGLGDGVFPPGNTDFSAAAAASIPAVVHIKTKTKARRVSNNLPGRGMDEDLFEQLFGGAPGYQPEQQASGSGVLISADGYIATNNHVVDGADEVTVTLSNKKTFTAKVVGNDPAYDLAVIKIDAANLPFLLYGNSDDVKIGQWVLAIGYPLNLETTVTAGIISAKGRTIGLNQARTRNTTAVESYLQTDAAVNMGNSGGALVDTDGKLIGINSAIASPSGLYTGYSYAIPVNIAKKVVDDIIRTGTVQRAFLGIAPASLDDLTTEQKQRIGAPLDQSGLWVADASTDGSAYSAGIRKGDIISKIGGVYIGDGPTLQEQMSRYKPGDKTTVSYIRGGKEYSTEITFRNQSGNFDAVKVASSVDRLGVNLANLDAKTAKQFGVPGGVVIKKINEGAVAEQTRMSDNFVVMQVNNQAVNSVEEFNKAVGSSKTIVMNGFYPGYDGVLQYTVRLK